MMRRLGLAIALGCAVTARAKPPLPDWIAAAAKLPLPSNTAGAKAVVLLDDKRVIVDPAGEITTRTRRVLRVLTAEGVDLATPVAFSDDEEKLLAFNGWTIGDSGTFQTFRERDAIETTSSAWELYADTRMKFLQLPVRPGEIAAWEIESRERAPLMHVAWPFQDEVPVLDSRLSVDSAGMAVDARWSSHGAVDPVQNGTVYTWSLQNIPAVGSEERMPPIRAVAGRMDININRRGAPAPSWTDIGRWYWELSAASVNSTSPELQRRAKQLAGADAWWAKVQPIARFAQQDVRYVAIEIGIGGYKPHTASEIFTHRFGDCKDKVTVLRAMLREAGIESHYILVNATPGIVGEFPTVSAFNHAIIAIRVPASVSVDNFDAVIDHPRLGRLLIFDPTSSITPLGHLPVYLQGSRGLVVTSDGGEIVTLPTSAAAANKLLRTAKLRVIDGGLTGEVDELRSGSRADDLRAALQPLHGEGRLRYIERHVTPPSANVTVSDIKIEGADDAYSDLRVHYAITISGALAHMGDMVLLRPGSLRHDEEDPIDAKVRKHPYVTDGPATNSEEIEIALPGDLAIDELPAAVKVASSAVSYSSRCEADGNVLHFRRSYEIKALAVPAASTAEFMTAMSRIRADERNSVVLKER